jgi:hypothetical protein
MASLERAASILQRAFPHSVVTSLIAMNFDRSKLVAVITGIFSLLLGFLYLAMVQLLDMRGEMIPAPLGLLGLG